MNNQKALSITTEPLLKIHSVFKSIQGEGPFVGMPAVFIRFAGCNLQCPQCDTVYESSAEGLKPRQVLNRVSALASHGLVVLTGGEPFRQAIGDLVAVLARNGYKVQIETNGTLYQSIPWGSATVVCSPKVGVVHALLEPRIKYYKYVVEDGKVSQEDGLPQSTMGFPVTDAGVARPPKGYKGQVFIMPLDSQDKDKNKKNLDVALWSCYTFGYRLCLQIHKMIGVE